MVVVALRFGAREEVAEEGGIGVEDSALANPTMDGHHVFSNANAQGGKAMLEYLYAGDEQRAANMYETEPTRFLPAYENIIDSDAFRSYSMFQEYPGLLEDLDTVANEILPERYGNNDMPGTLTNSPVGVYYYRFFHQAEMVNRVVTDTATPQEAFEYGRERANEIVEEARDLLGR